MTINIKRLCDPELTIIISKKVSKGLQWIGNQTAADCNQNHLYSIIMEELQNQSNKKISIKYMTG